MTDFSLQGLTLLPDTRGSVQLEAGMGPVHAVHPAAFAADARLAMAAGEAVAPDVLTARSRLRERIAAGNTASWRGLLAAALLLDTWPGEARLSTLRISPDDSPLAEAVLRSAALPQLTLLLLSRGDRQAVLGTLDPDLLLVPAADLASLSGLLPEEVDWYDRERQCFDDPSDLLSENDRLTLRSRLEACGEAGAPVAEFAGALAEAENRVRERALRGEDQDYWRSSLRAVLCLREEETFSGLTAETVERLAPGDNPLLRALSLPDGAEALTPQTLWRWQGVPFARSSRTLLLEGVHHPEAEDQAAALAAEEALLSRYSARYRSLLPTRLAQALQGAGEELASEAAELMRRWLAEAQTQAAARPPVPELTWPYDVHSPALSAILREALGDTLAEAAADPFSDRLLLLREGSLGDAGLDGLCQAQVNGTRCMVVPPLSPRLAEHTARYGGLGRWLSPEGIRVTVGALGRVEVSLLLTGEGTVRLRRGWEREGQLLPDIAPEVALWPAVSLPGIWRCWYLSARGGIRLHALRDSAWVELAPEGEEASVFPLDTCPGCVSLTMDGWSCGALLLPQAPFTPERRGAAVAALDIGSSGIGMALGLGGFASPAQLPGLWRPLLSDRHLDPNAQPLPTGPVGPVQSAVVRLWAEGEDPLPFEQGAALTPGALDAEAEAEAGLLWRRDSEALRARRLLLRQTMLTLSLHAAMQGAESIRWRASLPATMDRPEREDLLQEIRDAAVWTERRTGLRQATGEEAEAVRASLAEGLWLRRSNPLSPAFALMDVGASATTLAVWVGGMDRPAFELNLKDGLAAMLIPALTARPQWLKKDFGQLTGLTVSRVCRELAAPPENSGASRLWREMDVLFGTRLAETAPLMNAAYAAGRSTYSQALLLLGYASRFTLLGMALEELTRSSFAGAALPAQLPLYLCGRGTLPLTMFDERIHQHMLTFLRLGMNSYHPVRSVRLMASPACKAEAALGACTEQALPQGEPDTSRVGGISLGKLLLNFLMLFRAAFPEASLLLLSSLYQPGGALTEAAWEGLVALAEDVEGDTATGFLTCLGTVVRDTAEASAE